MKPLKPLAVPAFMLMILLSAACKKDHNEPKVEPPIEKKPSVEWISMKLDGVTYVDSLTAKGAIQKTNPESSLFEINGVDKEAAKQKGKALLYLRIHLEGHEIKKGVYVKSPGIDNAIQWQISTPDHGLQDYFYASGTNLKDPDAPTTFKIEITSYDGEFVEGTFSGTAKGTNAEGVRSEKEITEGKFKIAKKNIAAIN
ncbi:hypothetical protein [Chitinophaga flava]|uniref:Lipid/polyisoprenoid-binding YceI-like domain-containing protein n=1 Tax=Chitinophaga flava TaxID=2259036 RepID=A0A365Y078_9BACT|nr:hypothetical protein [Chitinophaga flava]RBL92016.1 hypothetical protein DF182_05305 [Chitinophaga flava]